MYDMRHYTSLELGYILDEVLTEITRRQHVVEDIERHLGEMTYQFTHEIEFGRERSRKEKADFYEEFGEHLTKRRIAKREAELYKYVFNNFVGEKDRIVKVLRPGLKGRDTQYKTNRTTNLTDAQRWERFYAENYQFKNKKGGL